MLLIVDKVAETRSLWQPKFVGCRLSISEPEPAPETHAKWPGGVAHAWGNSSFLDQPISWMIREEMEVPLSRFPTVNRRGVTAEHALLAFLYSTGARVSEETGLQVPEHPSDCIDRLLPWNRKPVSDAA